MDNAFEFKLDRFQEEAISHIDQGHSVIVAAPTGAGKTVIAEWALKRALAENRTVIYTAPIKALSNQKFRDFREEYPGQVGIVTGDVSLNPDAPILIMTTEIYRNSLFEGSERIKKLGWVIFDEIHYLDDPERGTVWEEALMFTPPEVHILALSATVPNVDELAAWIRSLHGRNIVVVKEHHRPVPLEFLYQAQGRILRSVDQLSRIGYEGRSDWRPRGHRHRGRHWHQSHRAKPNRLDTIIRQILDNNQIPCIYFAFSRRKTEHLAEEACSFDFLNENEQNAIEALYNSLLERHQLAGEKSAEILRPFIRKGIAYHHAGMLPTLKEVVEQLFTSRCLKLIFTTETFALGINMPARAVIFDELQKYYGTGFKNLTTRDFYQMAGRAGRRGMDSKGFVYMRLRPHDITLQEVERIVSGKPEPIRSQLNATYATLLNLYGELGRKLVSIYPQTFHHFQSRERGRRQGVQVIEQKLDLLKDMGYIDAEGLLPKGEFAMSMFGYELMLGEMQANGVLDALNEMELCLLLVCLVYEPRKGAHPPRLTKDIARILKTAEYYHSIVHRKEAAHHVQPYTRPPHANLGPAIWAWGQGATFDRLFQLTDVDEGGLVRNFRMVVQLLRELRHAKHTSDRVRTVARRGQNLISRDVIDAERQLRV